MTWNWSNVTGQNKSSEAILDTGGHVSVYKVPERGMFDSSKISSSFNLLASNSKRQWSLWKSYIRPTLNSLPAGARDDRWDLDPKTDALLYGLHGATIMVNNDATSTTSNGRYWDSSYERPITIAEAFESIFDQISGLESASSGSEEVDLSDYAYLPGTSGGQTLYGGTDASDNLSLFSTSDSTKGSVYIGSSNAVFDGTGKLTINNDDALTLVSPYNASVVLSGDNTSIASTSSSGLVLLGANGTSLLALGGEVGITGYDCTAVGLNANKLTGSNDPYIYLSASANSGAEDGDATIDIESDLAFGVTGTSSVNVQALNTGSNVVSDSTVYIRSYTQGVTYSGDSKIQLIARKASDAFTGQSSIEIGHEEILFDDQNRSGSTFSTAIKLSDATSEWNDFETNFGEVSILNAINQASVSGGGISDWGYLDTVGPSDGLGGSVTPTLVYQLDGTPNQLNERVAGFHNLNTTAYGGYVANTPLSPFGSTICNSGIYYNDKNSLYTTTLTSSELTVGSITCEWVGVVYGYGSNDCFFSIRNTGVASQNGTCTLELREGNGYGDIGALVEYNSSGTDESKLFDWTIPIGIPIYLVLTRDSTGLVYNLYCNGFHVSSLSFINTAYLSATPLQQLALLGHYRDGDICGSPLAGGVSSFRMTVGEEFSQAQVTEVWNSIKPS